MGREEFCTRLTCDLAALNNLLVRCTGGQRIPPAVITRLHEAIDRLLVNAHHLHAEYRIFFPQQLTIECTMAATAMLKAFRSVPPDRAHLGNALVCVQGAYAICDVPKVPS